MPNPYTLAQPPSTGNQTFDRWITKLHQRVMGTSSDGGNGYAQGQGGKATQGSTSGKSTGVTLDKLCGQITMNNAALGAGARVSFVVSNALVAATDAPKAVVASGGTANAYTANVTAVGDKQFTITVKNETAGSLSEAPVITFIVHKAVTS